MTATEPIIITSRLLFGVKVGNATVSIDYAKRSGGESRTRYQWYVDLDTHEEFSGDDLQSGCQGGNLNEGLASLLTFLSACGESYPDGDNADLFPAKLAEWCAANQDEISLASMDIEENQPIEE